MNDFCIEELAMEVEKMEEEQVLEDEKIVCAKCKKETTEPSEEKTEKGMFDFSEKDWRF